MSDSGWLNEKEQRGWRSFIAAYAKLFAALDQQTQRDAGIPLAYYEIMARLSEQPGRQLRMSELADHLGRSRSRLSHAITRLEERGWVTREPVPTDRRGQLATLLPAGYDVLRRLAPGHVRTVREMFIDQLTPGQLERMEQACRRVSDYIDSTGVLDTRHRGNGSVC